MRNLEGIKLSEIKESELEKKSITVDDDYNYDDCALTEKERNSITVDDDYNYDDCALTEKEHLERNSITVDDDYNFDDCALTEKEHLEKIKQELIKLSDSQQNNPDDDFEDCRKNGR